MYRVCVCVAMDQDYLVLDEEEVGVLMVYIQDDPQLASV